jgi:hypothetical protein
VSFAVDILSGGPVLGDDVRPGVEIVPGLGVWREFHRCGSEAEALIVRARTLRDGWVVRVREVAAVQLGLFGRAA